jgi:hypothetical protein
MVSSGKQNSLEHLSHICPFSNPSWLFEQSSMTLAHSKYSEGSILTRPKAFSPHLRPEKLDARVQRRQSSYL